MKRLITGALFSACAGTVLLGISATPSLADTSSAGGGPIVVTTLPGGGVSETITLPGTPGGDGKSPTTEGVSLDPCTYAVDPDGSIADIFNGPTYPTDAQTAAGQVQWYEITCPGQQPQAAWVLIGQPAPGPPPPTPGQLAVVARNSVQVPKPLVSFSPVVGLVNLPTWLWVDQTSSWHTVTATLTLRGTNVTVVATPKYTTWNPGVAGVSVRCDGPGVPWPAASTYCSYTYTDSSAGLPANSAGAPAYGASVSTTWGVHFVGNAPGGAVVQGNLADVVVTSDYSFAVQERQTIVTLNAG